MNPFASPAPAFAPPPLATRQTSARFVVVLAWCMIGLSAIACIVSVVSLLMVIAGSYGTANTSLRGSLLVMGTPPLTLVAGIGLLRRSRWAYGYVFVLLGFVGVWNVAQMLRGPTPQRYTSPSGVPTTILASHGKYPTHVVVVAVSLGLLSKLLTEPVRTKFRPKR